MNKTIRNFNGGFTNSPVVISVPHMTKEIKFSLSVKPEKNTGDTISLGMGFNETDGDGQINSNFDVKYKDGYYTNRTTVPIGLGNNEQVDITGNIVTDRNGYIKMDFKVWQGADYAPSLGYLKTREGGFTNLSSIMFKFVNQSNYTCSLNSNSRFILETAFNDEKIGLIGDSITADYAEIFDQFNTIPFSSKNLGYAGKGVSTILNNIKGENLFRLEEINLMAGINDRGLTLDSFRSGYQSLYDYIMTNKNENCIPTFIKILVPCNENTGKVNGINYDEKMHIYDMNNIVSEIVDPKYLIDLNQYMDDGYGYLNSNYSKDGIHFNDLGMSEFSQKLNYILSRRRSSFDFNVSKYEIKE